MAANLTLDWDVLGIADAILQIQVCRPVSQGVLVPPKGLFRTLATPDQQDGTIDLTTDFQNRYGRLIAGEKIFLRCRTVYSTGLASQWLERNQTIL